jgi:deoxyinosine 3'endonuclease (endonuclease V)
LTEIYGYGKFIHELVKIKEDLENKLWDSYYSKRNATGANIYDKDTYTQFSRLSDLMILAVDVHYKGQKALVAGVLFENWDDDYPCEIFMSTFSNIEKYEPGQFYKRELPCILRL